MILKYNPSFDNIRVKMGANDMALFFKKRNENKKKIKEFEDSLNYKSKLMLKHKEGLPTGNDVFDIFLCAENIVIKNCVNNMKFKIEMKNIINCYETQKEEKITEIKSSLGKTILGGALLGNVGAIIGAMPKSKEEIKDIHNYLIIIYENKDNMESMLVFESGKFLYQMSTIKNFILEFRKLKFTQEIIEL